MRDSKRLLVDKDMFREKGNMSLGRNIHASESQRTQTEGRFPVGYLVSSRNFDWASMVLWN
jgi:hypothetical protein